MKILIVRKFNFINKSYFQFLELKQDKLCQNINKKL